MALQVVSPTPNRLTTYTRSDDNVPRTTAMSTAVNPPDEAIARGVVWLDQNRLPVTLDSAAIYALLNEALTDYAAHIASAVFHAVADGTNTVSVVAVADIQTAITRTNLLRTALLAHMNNTGGAYHTVTDATNIAALTAVPACSDVPTLVTLLRAIKAYFNAHRTQGGVHPVNDGVNAISAADPIAGTITGPFQVVGDVDINGDLRVDGDTILNGTGFTSGDHTFGGTPKERSPQDLTDADHSLNPAAYSTNRLRMLTAPAANRILTLETSGPVPEDGDWFEITVLLGLSAFTVGVQIDGSADYVCVFGDGVGTSPYASSNQVATARVEWYGGTWHLVSVGGGPVFYGADA